MTSGLAAPPAATPVERALEPRDGTSLAPGRAAAAATVACAGLALLTVLLLGLVVGGATPLPATGGLSDPGPLTRWGSPVAALAVRVAALGTVGALLFAAVLAPTGRALPGPARRGLRAASWWAMAWAAATALDGLLTLSSLAGVPVTDLPAAALVTFTTQLAPGRSTVLVVCLVTVVALSARSCTTQLAAAAALTAALAAVALPAVLTGHSAAADDHMLAVSSLGLHVLAAALWVGGLGALVLLGSGTPVLATAAARFSALALACLIATATSGLTSAWLLLGGTADALAGALGTGYGWLLTAKTAGLLALGGLGWWHRRRALPLLRSDRPGAFRRLALVETGVMLATVALAVALSASPPLATATAPAAGPPSPATGATSTGPTSTGQTSTSQASGSPTDTAVDPPGALNAPGEDMSGHDHGDLSVGVLVDDTRFHVAATVTPGQPVTVYNQSTTDVTITAHDGSFDTAIPGQSLVTFTAPESPGRYAFSSNHSAAFTDELVVT